MKSLEIQRKRVMTFYPAYCLECQMMWYEKKHTPGQRVEDLVKFAIDILGKYKSEYIGKQLMQAIYS